MTLKIAPHRPTPAQRGFTLIELMIAVVVVGVLLAIALPSFMDSIRKGRRAEAFAALAQVQAAQERWRANAGTYANNAQLTLARDADPPGLGLTSTTASGYYNIAIAADSSSATGYIVTATAATGSSQAADGDCKVLAAQMAGGTITFGYGSAADSITWPDAGRCWAR